MFLKRFTISSQLMLVITVGGIFILSAMSYVLIRMHNNFAEHQFVQRHDRLTALMANEMAPALHLGDGRIIGKKVKAFVSTAEENLLLLRAYDLEGNKIYEKLNSEQILELDSMVMKYINQLKRGDAIIKNYPQNMILLKPAFLAGNEIGGFIGVAWSKHELTALGWELIKTALIFTISSLVIGGIGIILVLHYFITKPVGKMVLMIDRESNENANANSKLSERTQRQSSSL